MACLVVRQIARRHTVRIRAGLIKMMVAILGQRMAIIRARGTLGTGMVKIGTGGGGCRAPVDMIPGTDSRGAIARTMLSVQRLPPGVRDDGVVLLQRTTFDLAPVSPECQSSQSRLRAED